jgi:hypothetical protein
MDSKRRYIFNGSAVAFGGRLVRPTDVVLASDGASALSVSGGRVAWKAGPQQFGRTVRLKAASTFAEGLFDDLKRAIAVTEGAESEDSQTATTSVNAEVNELSVGDLTVSPPEPEFKVRRIRVSLTSRNPTASSEAYLRLGDDTAFEGVAVGAHKLRVKLEKGIFQTLDTRAKLLTAADDPKWVRKHGHLFNLAKPVKGKMVPVPRSIFREGGLIVGTIVKELAWEKDPFPGSEIDRNVLTIPNFGKVHFGEILIKSSARRVTMVRLQLGSPSAGPSVYGDVDANGTWSV